MRLFLLLAFTSHLLWAGTVPSNLVPTEINRIVEAIGGGSLLKQMGLFRPRERTWPGVKAGIEFQILESQGIGQLGASDSSLPSFLLVPRINIYKKWPWTIETRFIYMPQSSLSSVGMLGAQLSFLASRDDMRRINISPFAGIVNCSGFDSTFSASTFEIGVTAQKENNTWDPYVGISAVFSRGGVDSSFAAKPEENSGSYSTLHLFAGMEWRFMEKASFAAQLDFLNLSPKGSVMGLFRL